MNTYSVSIRPRRQVTFPSQLLSKLGVSIGDELQIKFEDKKAVLLPQKQIALDALKEIQALFSQSKIKPDEFFKR